MPVVYNTCKPAIILSSSASSWSYKYIDAAAATVAHTELIAAVYRLVWSFGPCLRLSWLCLVRVCLRTP